MSKIEITREELDDALDNADVELREDYSGRGMYGETCIGVVGSTADLAGFERELAKATTLGEFDGVRATSPAQVLDVYMERLEDIQNARREDSMGMDQIYYYPRLKLEG